jgi:hypothetical protein
MLRFVLAGVCLGLVLTVPAKAAPVAPERALEQFTSAEFGSLNSIGTFGRAAVWSSDDGRQWTEAYVDDTDGGAWTAICTDNAARA